MSKENKQLKQRYRDLKSIKRNQTEAYGVKETETKNLN